MGQILVRNISEGALARLEAAAAAEGATLEDKVRAVIEAAASHSQREALEHAFALGREAKRWREERGITEPLDVVALIREDRDNEEPHR
ncbi:MAG: hypothetical protein NW203_13080 [Hyphomonadaceae bacterium]|nr:hypothetical protein [Hyphomonadaceae bacterium]